MRLVNWNFIRKSIQNIYTFKTLENQSLDQICAKLDEFLEQLDSTELSVCLLYLNKMGANVKHPTLQNLSHKCIQLIERKGLNSREIFTLSYNIKIDFLSDSEFPLTALSRFSVALNSIRGELYSQLLFIKAIPSILKFIENCKNLNEKWFFLIYLVYQSLLCRCKNFRWNRRTDSTDFSDT